MWGKGKKGEEISFSFCPLGFRGISESKPERGRNPAMKTAQQRLNEFLGKTPEELEALRDSGAYDPDFDNAEFYAMRRRYGAGTRQARRALNHYLVLKYQVWEENASTRQAAYEAAPRCWLRRADGTRYPAIDPGWSIRQPAPPDNPYQHHAPNFSRRRCSVSVRRTPWPKQRRPDRGSRGFRR